MTDADRREPGSGSRSLHQQEKERIKNMERSLKLMPYAQAHVSDYSLNGYRQLVLTSYRTAVIIVTGKYMKCTGLYSMTTRKHISAFLREYFPHISFYDVKEIAGRDDMCIDIITGEAMAI